VSGRAGTTIALALVLALAGGCRPETVPASGEAADSYFPMVEGTRWSYELRTGVGALKLEVLARGPMPVRGQDLPLFVMEERNEGPNMGFVETAPVGYVVLDGYVSRFPGVDYTAEGELRMLGRDEPTRLLPVSPHAGQVWSQHHSLFATPEGGGGQLGWSARVESLGRLRVPAGTFEDVIVVHSSYANESPYEHGPPTKVFYEDYYARGVGLIRSVTRDTEGGTERVVEQVLLEYRFPD
jgi:hypothetical protein